MTYAQLEKFLFEKVSETSLAGTTLALIKDQEVVWSGAVGFKNLELGLAATPDTLYGIGSVTKSFTVLAALLLEEAGKLSLDDPIDKYVPFPVKPFGEEIKLWHLLSHTSGIPALGHAEAVIGAAIGDADVWIPAASHNDLLAFLQDAAGWVQNKPGERWYYLNEGYELVGAVIEKVSGMPLADFVKQNILLPLGMTRSTYHKADFDKDIDAAVPYINASDGKRIPSGYAWGSINAAGGLISSVHEMAKIVSMYLNWGAYPGGRLLSKASLEKMQTPRIDTPPKENPFGQYRYALGLGVTPNFLGRRLVGHSGSVGTATAYMGFIPDEKVGVVALVNGSGYSPSFMGQYGLAMLLGEDPEKLPYVKTDRLLTELTGNYETYKGTTRVTVKKAGDFLMMVSPGKYGTSTTPLIPVSIEGNKRTFYTLSSNSKVYGEFTVEPDKTTFVFERYAYRKTGSI
jgi:CubicO group peptidase (beta-lactamase class C family)